MKILHFNSNISKNSGVLSVIMNYYKTINKDAIQFDFLYFRDSDISYKDEIKKLGGRVYAICDPKNVVLFRKQLKNFLKLHQNEYDIVHIHDSIFARFMYNVLKKNGVKCVIIHSHATNYSDRKISTIRNSLLCHNIYKYADALFACSQAAGKFMFCGKKFYVMNNAIITTNFRFSEEKRAEIRKKMNIKDKFVVGHVGAFVNQKNHTFLLEIFKEILKKNKNSVLLLIGDGPLFQDIVEKVKLLKIEDKVVFLGKRSDVNDLYQAMDIFILPSLFEGLPMVGVEAQCSSLPIIMSTEITEEAGIRQFKFLKLTDDANIWAEKTIKMYKNNQRNKEKALEAITSHGFNIEVESEKLESKYFELILR